MEAYVRRVIVIGLVVGAIVAVGKIVRVDAAIVEQPAVSDSEKFVGTYSLTAIEIKETTTGEWAQDPNFNSIGYITYADTGHMGVHVMPRSRVRFTLNPPSGEEAQAALGGYTACLGSFTVDDQGEFVVHHRLGQIDPGGATDAKRFYDFEGDRLILTPAPPDGGGKNQANRRIL